MSTSVTFSSAHRILLGSTFFIARQPILDAQRRLAAHAFLFCHPAADQQHLATPASASVLADVAQHGLLRLVGERPAYLEVDADALSSAALESLPTTDTVLVLPQAAASEELSSRLAAWRQRGYRFALDAGSAPALSSAAQALLPATEGVHFALAGRDPQELEAFCRPLRDAGKQLLAAGVDTQAQFERCRALGCQLFRGRFLFEAEGGGTLSPSQLALTQLLALLAAEASDADIEEKIKGDPALGLHLLRLVNTPALSVHRIASLHQALMILGRNQLQRCLQLLLFGAALQLPGARSPQPLLLLATTRARLLELAAQKLYPGSRAMADTAFTVGIMSLLDRLLGMPLPTLLAQLPVAEEVAQALLEREGRYGELLWLAELCEWHLPGDDTLQQLQALLPRLRLSHHELYGLQLDAFEWSDHVARGIG